MKPEGVISFRLWYITISLLYSTCMKQFHPIICSLGFLCSSLSLSAQLPLFQSDDILSLTLTADWGAVQEDRGSRPNYHEAVLTITDESGDSRETKVKVKARGNYRKDPFLCQFPPLRMKLSKHVAHPHPFTLQRKLKIVTHCASDEYILREYYLYKCYQMFTEASFLVRLAEITYIDTEGIYAPETHYAFFIEDEDHMATRVGGSVIEEDILVESEEIAPADLLRVHIFNYMIANQDFVVADRQNVKIITNPEMGGRPVVVPYDFDWSGLVDASYTFQTNKSAYQARQKYKRICLDPEVVKQTILLFLEKREDIEALYENSPYLSEESIRYSLHSLKSFFRTINKSKNIERIFLEGCNLSR